MLWRSVVGKLWFTILLLVSVVLSVLMTLMLQSFERFHNKEAEKHLINHGQMVVNILEKYDDKEVAYSSISSIAEVYDARVAIIGSQDYWFALNSNETAKLSYSTFFEDPILSEVFKTEVPVVSKGEFPVYENGVETHTKILIIGLPLQLSEGETGAVYLYQSLSTIQETAEDTKKIIYFSAGIALILTTIFAFFLSSRITSPLRKMRQAVMEVTEGKFGTKVPILTNDEIGQLAIVFNRMGRELNRHLMALNQEKEQLSRILSSMADGVITIDRKGTIVLTNPPAEQFLQAWYYEQGITSIDTAEIPKDILKLFQLVVALEREQATEIDIQGRSWAVLMSPLYDETFVRGSVAVIRDMTEERRHDKLRKDFIANVSHELRTPLSMLQGYSEAIIDDIAKSDEEKKEIAQIIYDESLRMGRLVNELLDIARMEAGYIELRKDYIDVKVFSERVIRKFQGLSKDHNVWLLSDVDVADCQIQMDPDRVEQVLTNLIHNAIRYTEADGSVKLIVTEQAESIRFDVEDNGKGIPEEDLPFVFERFYKADKARTRGRSGTGLGLAIVKQIVEAHGGHISVHSKLNEGSTFTFFIPKNYDEI